MKYKMKNKKFEALIQQIKEENLDNTKNCMRDMLKLAVDSKYYDAKQLKAFSKLFDKMTIPDSKCNWNLIKEDDALLYWSTHCKYNTSKFTVTLRQTHEISKYCPICAAEINYETPATSEEDNQ